jgi:hypothetical protein
MNHPFFPNLKIVTPSIFSDLAMFFDILHRIITTEYFFSKMEGG